MKALKHTFMMCGEELTQMDTILRRNCNAGVTITSMKGLFGMFDVWLIKSSIVNLISIPQLEAEGFYVM